MRQVNLKYTLSANGGQIFYGSNVALKDNVQQVFGTGSEFSTEYNPTSDAYAITLGANNDSPFAIVGSSGTTSNIFLNGTGKY